MSTNSTINLYNPKVDKFKQVFAHWDGYYAWAGMQLLWHYRNLDDVTKLVKYGSISTYGAPLWNVGITPELLNSPAMFKINKQKALNGEDYDSASALFVLKDFTSHYYNESAVVMRGAEFREHLKRYDGSYDYCYINNWWYVSEKVNGKPTLVPLTYGLCEYLKSSGGMLCTLDIVVRDADKGSVFTYDYFNFNLSKFEHRTEVMEPSIRLINKVAKEVSKDILSVGYNGMRGRIVQEYKTMNRGRNKCGTSTGIKEAPWLNVPDALYLWEESYRGNEYTLLQSTMDIVSNMWSAGVQLLFNVSESTGGVAVYCRINLPEFEELDDTLLKILSISKKDIVVIDGLHWLDLMAKPWTQANYTAFVEECDRRIKEKHPNIELK